jgi:hypothetical protein
LVDILLKFHQLGLQAAQIFRVQLLVFNDLTPQIRTGIPDHVAVMQRFDGSFEREGDKQTDRDRQQMEGEILPRADRSMRGMNIQCGLLGMTQPELTAVPQPDGIVRLR